MTKDNKAKDFTVVAQNRKALHDYEILERVEAGIELRGTEVKSIRAGRINLLDSYAHGENGELYLYHAHVSPYEQGNRTNHDPYRRRKLLLHGAQIFRLSKEVELKQLALIPLAVYFKKQWVKVEIGLGRGRKKYDKRQKIAAADSKRKINQLLKAGGR
jgi:SsrA-binding protein